MGILHGDENTHPGHCQDSWRAATEMVSFLFVSSFLPCSYRFGEQPFVCESHVRLERSWICTVDASLERNHCGGSVNEIPTLFYSRWWLESWQHGTFCNSICSIYNCLSFTYRCWHASVSVASPTVGTQRSAIGTFGILQTTVRKGVSSRHLRLRNERKNRNFILNTLALRIDYTWLKLRSFCGALWTGATK